MNVHAIAGLVRDRSSGKPIAGARVRAYDRDTQTNNLVGEAVTAADGRFAIARDTAAFAEFVEDSPDVVFDVEPPNGGRYTARRDLRWGAAQLLPVATIDVPAAEVREAQRKDQKKNHADHGDHDDDHDHSDHDDHEHGEDDNHDHDHGEDDHEHPPVRCGWSLKCWPWPANVSAAGLR